MPVTGNITTGQAKSSDVAGKISRGEVGGLFNLKGVKAIREMQELAVEKAVWVFHCFWYGCDPWI